MGQKKKKTFILQNKQVSFIRFLICRNNRIWNYTFTYVLLIRPILSQLILAV